VAESERRAVHVVSYGWAGARAADVARHQLPRAIEPLRATETDSFLAGADLVAIVIGSNDTTTRPRPAAFAPAFAAPSTASARLRRRRGSCSQAFRHSAVHCVASSL
jgi:lysophospholipase L1-like esterase